MSAQPTNVYLGVSEANVKFACTRCGREIKYIHHFSNGDAVGIECCKKLLGLPSFGKNTNHYYGGHNWLTSMDWKYLPKYSIHRGFANKQMAYNVVIFFSDRKWKWVFQESTYGTETPSYKLHWMFHGEGNTVNEAMLGSYVKYVEYEHQTTINPAHIMAFDPMHFAVGAVKDLAWENWLTLKTNQNDKHFYYRWYKTTYLHGCYHPMDRVTGESIVKSNNGDVQTVAALSTAINTNLDAVERRMI